MSRGLGELQRKILDYLEPDREATIPEIATHTHGRTVTRSDYECIRRALHGLEQKRKVGRLFFLTFKGVNQTVWTTDANWGVRFDAYCEYMEVETVKRCKGELPTLTPPDKSCLGDQSNTYRVGSAP